MAKKKAKKRKRTIPRGGCIIITGPGGERKLCKGMDGKVKFRRMSYKPRGRSA